MKRTEMVANKIDPTNLRIDINNNYYKTGQTSLLVSKLKHGFIHRPHQGTAKRDFSIFLSPFYFTDKGIHWSQSDLPLSMKLSGFILSHKPANADTTHTHCLPGEVCGFSNNRDAILEDVQQVAPRVSGNDIAFCTFTEVCSKSECWACFCKFNYISFQSCSWANGAQWTERDGDEAGDKVKMMKIKGFQLV